MKDACWQKGFPVVRPARNVQAVVGYLHCYSSGQMSEPEKPGYKVLELLRRFGFHPLEGTVIPPKPVPVDAATAKTLQPAGESIAPAGPDKGAGK